MIRYLAKTFSVAVTVAFAIMAATWPMRADMADGVMAAARALLPPVVINQAAPYPIGIPDCLRPMVQAGVGATGYFTLILPPASSVPNGCRITVKNGDTYPGGGAKKLSGFPSDWPTNLYPLLAGQLVAVNGVWQTAAGPGRWKPTSQITFHIDPSLGSDANDGLATGTGRAMATPQAAYNFDMQWVDNNNMVPIIAMAANQTQTSPLQMGGVPVGTNLIQLSPDGNGSFTMSNAGSCIVLADGAELDLRLNQYGSAGNIILNCNQTDTVNTGAVYMHNGNVVLDQESSTPVIWNPAGPSDNLVVCDGGCQYTWGGGVTQATGAGAAYMFSHLAGGHGTISGAITASGSGGLTGLIFEAGSAVINFGASGLTGWSSVGTSKLYHSTLWTNGISVPGSVTVGATSCFVTNSATSC